MGADHTLPKKTMMIKPEKLEIYYDDERDVLYISLGKSQEADDTIEPQDGVIVRSRNDEVIGITIVGLKKKMNHSKRKFSKGG